MSLFGPSNSVILAYDHFTPEGREEWESQLHEVGKYYRFAPLSEIASRLRRGKRQGLAAVALTSARKSAFLWGIPVLRELGIPFTLFVHPECVGTNRLPFEEELTAFATAYPERLRPEEIARFRKLRDDAPERENEWIAKLHKEVGPLPVAVLDPTRYFSTWGKVVELRPAEADIGVTLDFSPLRREHARSAIAYVSRQAGREVTLAHASEGGGWKWLEELKLQGLLTKRVGPVERKGSPWELGCWEMIRSVSR